MMEFEKFKEEILKCRLCEDRFGFEPHPIVFGNKRSKIMQISQAPSNNVHVTLKPFNDPSGKKLRNEWYMISDDTFYDPNNFYITAMAHCYPGKSKSGGDRQPPVGCARKWLKKELDFIDNELFIIIGSKAAKFLFPNEDFKKLIFSNNILNGKKAIVLPHPSPLNIKWFKENPEFYTERLFEIRKIIHGILNI